MSVAHAVEPFVMRFHVCICYTIGAVDERRVLSLSPIAPQAQCNSRETENGERQTD